VVAGFRFPAVWGFILLTKVTPGVGLLWFAVRREWRALGFVAVATAGVVILSFALAPGLWNDWIQLLASEGQSGARPDFEVVALALPLRLAIAALVVTWGARNDYRWTVPVAVFLAMPASWWITLSVLVAIGAVAGPARNVTSQRRPLALTPVKPVLPAGQLWPMPSAIRVRDGDR
jgi:hypothetical protein